MNLESDIYTPCHFKKQKDIDRRQLFMMSDMKNFDLLFCVYVELKDYTKVLECCRRIIM